MIKKLVTGGLLLASVLCAPIAEAAKIHQLVDATVYLKDGTTDQYKGARGAFMLSSNGYVSLALLHHYMKDAAPEFHKMLKEYYGDSPDAKAHCNELKDNPSIILDLYEEYLKTHDYIDDRPEVKVSDDEKEDNKYVGKMAEG